MPRKYMFTKEEITEAALNITRRNGFSALTARSLGQELGCSSKPVFGLFDNMESVQNSVLCTARKLYNERIESGMAEGKYPPYKASGMAYIGFAREEKELFRLLFMRDRSKEGPPLEDREELRPLLDLIMKNLGISEDEAFIFHIEMWIYVHGIASMIATSYLELDEETVGKMLTDMYVGLTLRYTEKQ